MERDEHLLGDLEKQGQDWAKDNAQWLTTNKLAGIPKNEKRRAVDLVRCYTHAGGFATTLLLDHMQIKGHTTIYRWAKRLGQPPPGSDATADAKRLIRIASAAKAVVTRSKKTRARISQQDDLPPSRDILIPSSNVEPKQRKLERLRDEIVEVMKEVRATKLIAMADGHIEFEFTERLVLAPRKAES